MRKFLSFGDGFPMTAVTLLVCGPVLFGLALIFFEPFRDPSWLRDFIVNPGKHPLFWAWVLMIFYDLFTTKLTSPEGEDESRLATTRLKWTADIWWAMSLGIFIGLAIIVDKETVGSGRENFAAYVAFGLAVISVALRWRDRRERMGFGRVGLQQSQ